MKFDILAQVAAWAILAASECPGVAHAIAPFVANVVEMRDERGGVRDAGLRCSTAAPLFYGLRVARRRGGAAVCSPAPDHVLARRRTSRAARRAFRSAAGCSAGTAANSPLAATDDVTTPSPQGPAAGRSSPLDILRAASEGIETKK